MRHRARGATNRTLTTAGLDTEFSLRGVSFVSVFTNHSAPLIGLQLSFSKLNTVYVGLVIEVSADTESEIVRQTGFFDLHVYVAWLRLFGVRCLGLQQYHSRIICLLVFAVYISVCKRRHHHLLR